MNLRILGYNGSFPDSFERETISTVFETDFVSGKLKPDGDSEYYPLRSDEKIMRTDIKEAIISIQNLIRRSGLSPLELNQSDIYVANGAFIENIEKFYSKLTNVYKNFDANTSAEVMRRQLYRASPPLVAVETLTNSTMSFISQYAGINGRNATFGTTSLAGFYALKEAMISLEDPNCKNVFVCSANCGGSNSVLSNSSTIGYKENWKESAAVGNLLFSKDETKDAVCEVTYLKSSKSIPNLDSRSIERNWENLLPDSKADLLLFSGAFNQENYDQDKRYCSGLNQNNFSLFPDFGNMGASNVLMNVIYGISQFSSEVQIIDIVDRDIYGRESLVRIKKC